MDNGSDIRSNVGSDLRSDLWNVRDLADIGSDIKSDTGSTIGSKIGSDRISYQISDLM